MPNTRFCLALITPIELTLLIHLPSVDQVCERLDVAPGRGLRALRFAGRSEGDQGREG